MPLVFKFENTFFVFLFSLLLYLFYFVSTYNKILIVAIFSSFFVLFSALFIFFCFLIYFFILFAFSFRKL